MSCPLIFTQEQCSGVKCFQFLTSISSTLLCNKNRTSVLMKRNSQVNLVSTLSPLVMAFTRI